MGASTGVVLAIGAITIANRSIFEGDPIDMRVVAATGLGAIMFTLAENVVPPKLVVGLAYIGLVTVVLTRVDPTRKSPAENALAFWDKK